MTLRARTTAVADLTGDDVARWTALCEGALEPHPFLDPAYVVAAQRWLPGAADIRLLVVHDDHRMHAVVPVCTVHGFGGLPLPYATNAGPFFGSYASVCAPLLDRQEPLRAAEALFDHLRGRGADLPGLFELTLIPEGVTLDTLRVAARRQGVTVRERYRFQRASLARAAGSVPRAHLSSSKRKQLRRHERALERELDGPLEFVEPDDHANAFEQFLELEASGWKGDRSRKGAALRVKHGKAEWYTEVADHLGRRGLLRVLQLRAGPELLYSSIVLQAGDTLYGVMDAYEERWSRYSPGVIGRLREQDYFLHETDAQLFDPCIHPKHAAPTALYPDRRTLVGLVLATRGAPNRAVVRWGPMMSRTRAATARFLPSRLAASA